ncbi:hypothetical protein CHS0354_037766 [Potamilus streckersoni]|uniref:Transglutaminase-like domain-containing protein n=1 Tax=Potamilus streckersoni TaxID=2493646 RepID=A0AAE0T443_9BIVA|nr:hypothetical protein CHS0354_037766 [Potamilus streckersoni]
MQAPSQFRLQNIQQQQPKIPPAVRSRYRKFDLYRDVSQFKFIDDHAIQVAQVVHASFRDLIWHLCYSVSLHSELDRARAIFRWMTAQNLQTISFQNVQPNTPEDVLTSFKNKKPSTYARIFETMCRFSGLQCVVLTGFAKGLDYRPGDKFKGTDYNHSWNAVYIDENWYLVDSHWATRYLVSERNKPEDLVYEYDDFYFLTDPEQLIYSHWAQKAEWQLLSHPLTLAEFEDLPLVKSYFFRCGMYFMSHQKGVVQMKNGKVAVTVGFVKPTNFTYKIVSAENGDETYQGHKLKSYCLQETRENRVTFIIRAPKSGAFYVTIFGQLLTGEIGIKNVFTASAEYKMIADKSASDAAPLPNCSDSNWGPGIPVAQLGLEPSYSDSVIPTKDGKIHIEFKKTKPVYLLCKLRKPGMKEEDLERCVNEADQGDKVIVTGSLPQPGEYGLEIYGNDPAKDGDTFTHICQYFVHYASPNEQAQAFYQESPDRRMQTPGQQTAMLKNGGYRPGVAGVTSGVANVHVKGPGVDQTDFDDLPPPPPELLQQQYLYGTTPQHGVYASVAQPQGQGAVTFRPGAGATDLPPPQKAGVSVIPTSSKPIKVEKRTLGQEPPAAPPTFKLIPVKSEQETAPPPKPAAGHQGIPSLEAIDRQVLHTVDDHAIQVSKSEHKNVRELVWDLIYSKNITNEIEKCRVIFRWLATKNLKEMNFDKVEKGSPEEILMGLKTGKTTYAMVFDTMCNYAGLHSKIISGYAKGADYRPGQKFTPGSNQHSWNAVYIYGTWCLIDAHWAARRIIGKQATTEEFHYQLDEYFFLPDTHQLIYTHFPDDPKWQLLERPVTLEEFENMPHMKPQFFKFGLEFVSHRTAVIYGRGEINLRLRYPAHRITVAFNFSIQFENGVEEYKGVKLNRYGLQESVGGIASFRLRLPQRGSYIIYIYAKEDTPENKDTVYAQVCEYKIVQEEVGSPEPEPFPPCAYLNWGQGGTFQRYGLSTYQNTAVIHTREGKAELQIRISRPMQFMAKLKNNKFSDSELEGYIMTRVVGSTAYFNVTAPARGEYGCEIYANDPATEGTTLYHVAQYLIECHEDVKAVPLPKLPAGYLGAQPKFNEFGLSTKSHHDPVVHLETNTVEIHFDTIQDMRVTANLIAVDDGKEKECTDYVFTQIKGSAVYFIVHLPQIGFYKLQLYAVPANDTSQQLPGVYNYLINCKKVTKRVYPFPKQYAQWKEGCFMPEPLVLHKDLGQDEVLIRVGIPKAAAVAIVAGDEWIHLKANPQGLWEGKIPVREHMGKNAKITLNANYGGDPTNYATLLEYTV